MKQKRILTALIVALLLNIAAFSENIDSVPVYVYYQYKSHVDGIKRPSRVPQNIQLSLAICYEASLQQLVFIDTQRKNYRYMIVDDSNNSIAEGYLDFSNKDSISVNLTSYNPGSYTLFVWYEDSEFFGTFTI